MEQYWRILLSQARYNELHAGLTVHTITGETGPHAFRSLEKTMLDFKPKTILEIGFNRGSSALSFLLASEPWGAVVYSVDVRRNVQPCVDYLQELFPNRFHYIKTDSARLLEDGLFPLETVDLVFIDGNHSYEYIRKDTETAFALNARYILYDEYTHPPHMKDVRKVMKELDLVLVEDYSVTFNDKQLFQGLTERRVL